MGEYIQFSVESLRKFRCKSPVMTLRLYHFGTLKSADIWDFLLLLAGCRSGICSSILKGYREYLVTLLRGHPYSAYAKYSTKNISTPLLIRTRVCLRNRNVSFSENMAYELNG